MPFDAFSFERFKLQPGIKNRRVEKPGERKLEYSWTIALESDIEHILTALRKEIIVEKKGGVITRRDFVKQAGGASLVVSSAGMTAQSYARILGASDRIRLGQIGSGACGESHVHRVYLANKQTPVGTAAVCVLWSLAREHRAAQVQNSFNQQSQMEEPA